MDRIKLTDDQFEAKLAVEKGKNIFLTGRGGTGKSVVAREITDKNTLVASTTGISALNVEGVTLHRLFKLPLGYPTLKDKNVIPKDVEELFISGNVKRVIVDEISMARPDHLDLIDWRLKVISGSNKQFGGVQVIPTGDFFQLESIVGYSEKEHFFSEYDTNFAFGANCWDFEMHELRKVLRNSNNVQVNMLNAIREKDPDLWKKAITGINQMTGNLSDVEDNDIFLCCYNADADLINNERIKLHDGKEHYMFSQAEGFSKSEIPVPENLFLKEGCRVMIKANNDEAGYVNGDRGVFKHRLSTGDLVVELDRGETVVVDTFTWEKFKYVKGKEGLEKEVEASYTQYPVILAYAVSIHKSQGLTLDSCVLDTGAGCFSHGQLYVALSRVRDLKKMKLANRILPKDLIVNKAVKDFYKNGGKFK